ncbi:MAG: hypothetical protein HZB66_02860 [Candidatus Aenigmarchaeota archaeon]|nr:hypothetical protein [Candidatus Aenigmarchaeota archaeon]
MVKELVFVVEGNGKITIGKVEHKLEKQGAVLIFPKQKYFFEGKLKLIVSCSPAWYPEQHKNIGNSF